MALSGPRTCLGVERSIRDGAPAYDVPQICGGLAADRGRAVPEPRVRSDHARPAFKCGPIPDSCSRMSISTVGMRRKSLPAARWSCAAAARLPVTTLRRRLGSLAKDTGRAYRQPVFSRPVRGGSGLTPFSAGTARISHRLTKPAIDFDPLRRVDLTGKGGRGLQTRSPRFDRTSTTPSANGSFTLAI